MDLAFISSLKRKYSDLGVPVLLSKTKILYDGSFNFKQLVYDMTLAVRQVVRYRISRRCCLCRLVWDYTDTLLVENEYDALCRRILAILYDENEDVDKIVRYYHNIP